MATPSLFVEPLASTPPVFLPLMTIEAYAAAAGIPPGVLLAQVDRGMWPTLKVGKRRLLNVAALFQQCAGRES